MGWLARRLGHRGAWLIVLGILWILFGIGQLVAPEPQAPWVLHQAIPAHVRAGAWILTGAIAVLSGARGRGVADAAGHVALWVMPALRCISYGASWVLYLATSTLTDRTIGYDHGWYAAGIWAFVIVMLHLVAAWPNPTARLPDLPDPPRFGADEEADQDGRPW